MLSRNLPPVTKTPTLLLTLSAAFMLGACSILSPRPATPISEVVSFSKGVPPEQTISRMRSSRTTYALRGSDFEAVDESGLMIDPNSGQSR